MFHKSLENLVDKSNFFTLLLVFLFIGNFSLFSIILIFVLSIIYLNCITKMLSFVLLYFLSYIDYIAHVLSFKYDQYLECVSLKRVHVICKIKKLFKCQISDKVVVKYNQKVSSIIYVTSLLSNWCSYYAGLVEERQALLLVYSSFN